MLLSFFFYLFDKNIVFNRNGKSFGCNVVDQYVRFLFFLKKGIIVRIDTRDSWALNYREKAICYFFPRHVWQVMAEPKILHDIVNNMCLSFYCHIIWSYFSSCKAHWQVYWSRSWLSYFSLGGCCWSFFCFFIFLSCFCVSLSSRSLPVTGYAKVAKRLPSGYRMRNVYGILVSLLCWHGISWSFRVSSCPASKEFQYFCVRHKTPIDF